MATKSVKVTQVKSTNGELKRIISSVKGLGLRRRHHSVLVQDTPEMAYELGWILARWPMDVPAADREYLESREALYERAKALRVPGRSKMSKAALVKALREARG